VSRAHTVTVDTSVWVPYLRDRRYASTIEPLVDARRAWLSSVVLLELYAGAVTIDDVRDVNAIRSAARDLDRLYHPTEDDLVVAGRVLSHQARRHGALRPRDHSHDLLIAIGAARTGSLLLTENRRDMERWRLALARRAKLRIRVATPLP
jgi:predicted nucleic acid-binding protein